MGTRSSDAVNEDKVKFIEARSEINLDKRVEIEEEEEVQAHMTIQILPISVLNPCILMQWNCNFLIQYRRVMSLKCDQDINQMLQLNIWINCLQIVIITIL